MVHRDRIEGQTLVEVLLVTGVMALLLTVLVSAMTTSIARNRLSQERSVAVRLAQEGVEWFRGERDRLGFNELFVALGSGQTICLVDVAIDLSSYSDYGSCDPLDSADAIHKGNRDYWREVGVTYQLNPERYEVVLTVDWEGNVGAPVEVTTEVARPL